MANKRFYQFLYSKQPKLTMITGSVQFAAGGKVVGSSTGAGVYSVTGFGNGKFRIKLNDNYVNVVGGDFSMISGIDAASVNVSLLVGSSSYIVTSLGNSNWTTVGLDSDYAAAVGSPFVATAVAGSGTGTAKLIIPSNVASVEMLPQIGNLLTNTSPNYGSPNLGRGSSIYFQTLAPTSAMVSSAAVTTMAAVNPVGSSQMLFKLWFRDSSAGV